MESGGFPPLGASYFEGTKMGQFGPLCQMTLGGGWEYGGLGSWVGVGGS